MLRSSTGPSRCSKLLQSVLINQQIIKRLQYATAAAASDIQLTESAIKRLKELQSQGSSGHLRLSVEAGGCSGFSYKFELDKEVKPGDRSFEAGGVRLVTDDLSLEFVKGAKIDYSDELIKSAFEVVDNPNADRGCGCGTSFTPK